MKFYLSYYSVLYLSIILSIYFYKNKKYAFDKYMVLYINARLVALLHMSACAQLLVASAFPKRICLVCGVWAGVVFGVNLGDWGRFYRSRHHGSWSLPRPGKPGDKTKNVSLFRHRTQCSLCTTRQGRPRAR